MTQYMKKVAQAAEDKYKWATSLMRVCAYETDSLDVSSLCTCSCGRVKIVLITYQCFSWIFIYVVDNKAWETC